VGLMPLNWKDNYWQREGDDGIRSWKVFLKTDVRNILLAMFDDSYKIISYIIKNESKIYNKYKQAGKLYMLDPDGNYHYEYLGPSTPTEITKKAKDSSEESYTIYCPQTTVTFLVNKMGSVIDSYQGRRENEN
jgi:hypothetical protein